MPSKSRIQVRTEACLHTDFAEYQRKHHCTHQIILGLELEYVHIDLQGPTRLRDVSLHYTAARHDSKVVEGYRSTHEVIEARDPLDGEEAASGSLVVILDGPLGWDRERGRLVA